MEKRKTAAQQSEKFGEKTREIYSLKIQISILENKLPQNKTQELSKSLAVKEAEIQRQ